MGRGCTGSRTLCRPPSSVPHSHSLPRPTLCDSSQRCVLSSNLRIHACSYSYEDTQPRPMQTHRLTITQSTPVPPQPEEYERGRLAEEARTATRKRRVELERTLRDACRPPTKVAALEDALHLAEGADFQVFTHLPPTHHTSHRFQMPPAPTPLVAWLPGGMAPHPPIG